MKCIEDKAMKAFIDNDDICQHAISELDAAGYFKTNNTYYKNLARRVIMSVAIYSLQSRSCANEREVELIKKLSLGEYIIPLTLKNNEFSSVLKNNYFINKRCNTIKLDKNSKIFDDNAFNVVYRHIYYYYTGIWNESKQYIINNATKLIEIDSNNICTGRILYRCYLKNDEIKNHNYFPKKPINVAVVAIKYTEEIVYYVKLNESSLQIINNCYDIFWANSAILKNKMITNISYSMINRVFKTIENKINK